MNIKQNLTNIYQKKIYIKRYYLNKNDISPERFFILPALLDIYYKSIDTYYLSLTTNTLKFDCYNYGDGYMLECVFVIFYNPNLTNFQALNNNTIINFINNILDIDLDETTKVLASAKRKIISQYNDYIQSSLNNIYMELETIYSYPYLNLNLIESLSIQEIQSTLELIKNSSRLIEINASENTNYDSLYLVSNKEKSFALNYNILAKDIFDNFYDESIAYIFSLKEITSLYEVSIYNILFNVFAIQLSEIIYLKYKIKCDIKFNLISKIKGLLSIKFKKGYSSLIINEAKELLTNFSFLKNNKSINKAIKNEKNKSNLLLINLDLVIERMKLIQDLLITSDGNSFFYQYNFDLEYLTTFKKEIKLVKRIICANEE